MLGLHWGQSHKTRFRHISENSVNVLTELLHKVILIQQLNNHRVTREVKLTDVIDPDKTRKNTRAFNSEN